MTLLSVLVLPNAFIHVTTRPVKKVFCEQSEWKIGTLFYFLFLVPHIFILLTYFKFRFGCAGSSLLFWILSSCGVLASHCGGFSPCRAGALGSSWDTWAR